MQSALLLSKCHFEGKFSAYWSFICAFSGLGVEVLVTRST
ncbi:hypothetical protein LINPERPRIM_LOCUS29462 [Linum perenne]